MGLEKNAEDPWSAMRDANGSPIDPQKRPGLLSEEDLLRIMPLLRHNPAGMRQLLAAVNENERPSDAIDSQGHVNGSDLPERFYQNMEGFRQREMIDPLAQKTQGQSQGMSGGQAFVRKALAGTSMGNRIIASENADPNEEHDPNENPRYFGEDNRTVGDGNQRAPEEFFGNSDPNDRRRRDVQGGGRGVADDLATPGNPDNFGNQAAHPGLPSVNNEASSPTQRWLRSLGSDGKPAGGPKRVPWIRNITAAGRFGRTR